MVQTRIVRVLCDQAAIDKRFDYFVPEGVTVALGDEVRIDLHGRRVGGWIVELDVEPPEGVVLRPLAKVRGCGPDAAVIDLAAWAAWRWTGRHAQLLRTASPPAAVRSLDAAVLGQAPASDRSNGERPGGGGLGDEMETLAAQAMSGGAVVVRLPPATSPRFLIEAGARLGPTLVVSPTQAGAAAVAQRLRRDGWPVALLPRDWAQARAGRSVVVGTRSGAFGPCPDLRAVVVLDADDEAHRSEAAPTWSAVEVCVERAARAGAPCVLVSAAPTPPLVFGRRVVSVSPAPERARWARVNLADRREDDPRTGLFGERFTMAAHAAARIVCVLNRTGRARRLRCGACGEIACCHACGAAVAEAPDGRPSLVCPRCVAERPRVCASCGGMAMRTLRVGVTKAREELAALLGRPVGEVTGATTSWPQASVLLGTEAVLGRSVGGPKVDLVAFLDIDADLLAPRVTAVDHVVGMLAVASRLVGQRRRTSDGMVVVQTRHPEHPALIAIAHGDPGAYLADELDIRAALRLPPTTAVARLSGPGAAALAASLKSGADGVDGAVVVSGPSAEASFLAVADDHTTLANALHHAERPSDRARVEVDPPRL